MFMLRRSVNNHQLHIINHRTAKRPRMIALHVIIRAKELNPGHNRRRGEPELGPFEPTLARGLIGYLETFLPGKSLHHHGPLTGIASIPNRKGQVVDLAGYGPDDLDDNALSSGHQLHGPVAYGNEIVGVIDVFDGF